MSDGANDGGPYGRVGMTPRHGNGIDAKGIRVRRQGNMFGLGKLGFRDSGVCVYVGERE